jgi:tetratricopeptide (TPR) repeat protein
MDSVRSRKLLLPLCLVLLTLPSLPAGGQTAETAAAPASQAASQAVSQAAAEALSRAQELLEDGNPKEAVKVYKEADKLAGGACVECQLGLAKAFNRLGAHKEVLKAVEAALALTTDKALLVRAHNERGLAILATAGEDAGKLQEAEKDFRQALELSGGSNVARFNLGVVLLRLGRDAEGVALLKEYLEKDPDAASAETARDLIANPLRARKNLIHDFEMATLAGDYLTTEELRGKVVLIDFCKNRMTWPQVWDKDHEITRKWGISSFPSYVLVSPEGEIVYTARGWSERLETEIQQRISSALRKAKKSANTGG